jgi:hypothetical protein
VARDAIARQYDVDKNSVQIDIKKGLITFFAKPGRSVDLDQVHASIQATRLSGRTGMRVHSLEITATGEVVRTGKPMLWKVAGTGQLFELAADPERRGGSAPSPFARLQEALQRGDKVVSVTGHLPTWNGPFPEVLKVPPGGADQVTAFETAGQ